MQYWNQGMETMSENDMRQLQLIRFKKIMLHAYEHSNAYRELYDAYHITPEDIHTFDDISNVPVTDKKFIAENLNDGEDDKTLAIDPSDIYFYHQTSGTTAKFIPQPDSRFDWLFHSECCAKSLWSFGIRKEDRVLVAFNYNLFIGFWECHYACERIGCEIVPAGGLSTEARLEKIRELNVTVIMTTPSYALKIAETAEKLGIDLKNSSVKILVTSGEPGGLQGNIKERLMQSWGADVYDLVGATEVGAWGFECPSHCGCIHVDESDFIPEILEFDSDCPITEPGKKGRLVLTSLFRSARPCIRFNTNDIACWSEKKCSCGRTYRMLEGGVQGRIDHIMKVKGTFVNPASIADIILKHPKCSGEYKIIIHEDNTHITVKIEVKQGIRLEEYKMITDDISKKIQNTMYLKMSVLLVPYGSIEKSEYKANRIVDLRKEKD